MIPVHIYCDPAFLDIIAKELGPSQATPFAENAVLAGHHVRSGNQTPEAWLLFRSTESIQGNMPVVDHINLTAENPLIGNDDPPRFPDMSNVYEAGGEEGVLICQGEHPELAHFAETVIPVVAGIWEAIALAHRKVRIRGWVIGDLDDWINKKLKSPRPATRPSGE